MDATVFEGNAGFVGKMSERFLDFRRCAQRWRCARGEAGGAHAPLSGFESIVRGRGEADRTSCGWRVSARGRLICAFATTGRHLMSWDIQDTELILDKGKRVRFEFPIRQAVQVGNIICGCVGRSRRTCNDGERLWSIKRRHHHLADRAQSRDCGQPEQSIRGRASGESRNCHRRELERDRCRRRSCHRTRR